MRRRSFFFKEYLSHFILIVVAFALAGGVFYYQMSSYALRAKQAELRTTVQSLAEQSKLMQGTDSDVIRELYMLSIARIAKEDELTVLVTDDKGNVQMAAQPNGASYTISGYHVPREIVEDVTKNGSYAAVGSVGVLTEATSYTVGSCVRDIEGNVAALIFVSCQDPATAGVVRHSTQTLVLILLVTLAVMLIISFILSQHITRPIKNIAAAAKEFASGNFDVRVPEDNHCYEIDELAVSFNNMASDLDQLEELTRGFISNVSHEFKTPMTTIGGFVDGMIDGTIPEDQRDKYLHIIAEETRRLSRMVNRMLDAAKIQSGELLLIDAGVEVNSLYTADITRTFPTNGKFTDFQKKLYQAVLDSQQAGFEAAKPGATYSDIHHACMRVIAERLHDWGILPVDVEESLSPEGQQHRRWLACGVAHHLGLDVHDCAQARYESYQNAKIRPGMIFTIEPGLYFREDDLLIPPEYRGIGIRIEDDVLMTEDGPEWISAGIPKQIDDVEAWMADMAAEGAKA